MNPNRSATWNRANAAAQDRHDARKAEAYRAIRAGLCGTWTDGDTIPESTLQGIESLAAGLTRAIGPVL